MSGGFGNDYISVSDDDGNEFELEHLDTVELNGIVYAAFLPADMDEDDEDFGLVVLKAAVKDGEEVLVTIDDDEERSAVFEIFAERLSDGEED